jgi:hypothetical protein
MTQRDGELRDRGSSFSLRERNLSPTSPASLHRSAEVRNGLGGPNVDGRTSAYLGMILARLSSTGLSKWILAAAGSHHSGDGNANGQHTTDRLVRAEDILPHLHFGVELFRLRESGIRTSDFAAPLREPQS